jgi:hypothetical protein
MPSAKLLLLLAAALAALLAGCHASMVDALPPQSDAVDRIRNDSTLTPQQQRTELEKLGISPLVINALLISERTANQFGGDLRTAYDKVTGGQLGELTPDEVQIFGDEASVVDTTLSFSLADAEAQAIVTFFQDNGIATKSELLNLLDDPAQAVLISRVIPDNALRNLFVDFDTDLLIPVLP